MPVNLSSKKLLMILILPKILEASHYPHAGSDIRALLIFDHQVGVHYELVEAAYKARQALFDSTKSGAKGDEGLQKSIDEIVNSLVPILLMKDEIQLGEKITRPNANSDFTKAFSSRSIKDSKGRSLRDFKFNKTIFKYSCSYMIYSKSFVSLPEVLKNAVFKRINDILNIKNKDEKYDYITPDKKNGTFRDINRNSSRFCKIFLMFFFCDVLSIDLFQSHHQNHAILHERD